MAALEGYEDRIAIIASNVGRAEKEEITITNAQDIINQGLNHPQVTMSTLIIICNSNAKLTSNGKVLTPRGYLNKYELDGELKA
jgi:precorrin-3B C17-methyltransferase